MASSLATVYLIYYKFKVTYDRKDDTFRMEFLIVPAAILSLLIRHEFTVMEVRAFAIVSLVTCTNSIVA